MSKRVGLIVAGAVLLAGGGVVAAGGAVVMAVVGSDNTVSTSRHALGTPTSALVIPMDDLNDEGVDTLGRPTVKLSVNSATAPVFIGVGPAAEVDRYLTGAAVDTVDDFELDPWQLSTTRHDGVAQPATPATQSFWVADADGATSAELAWKIREGDYRLVIMNADGSPGVELDGRLGVRIPHLYDIGITLLTGGLLVILAGASLLIVGLLSPRHPSTPVAIVFPRQPRPQQRGADQQV
jgi:hypothetical protein